jgi:hypothetical protein
MDSRVLVYGWQPSQLLAGVIEREFLELLAGLGIDRDTGPEAPAVIQYAELLAVTHAWHRDGSGLYWPAAIVTWSNRVATEVEGMTANDGDVIWIANRVNRHRVPSGSGPRWLCRAWVRD